MRSQTKSGRARRLPVPETEDHAPARQLAHALAHAIQLRRTGDDPDADGARSVLLHDPVFLVREVLRAVDGFDALDPRGRGGEQRGVVRAALGGLEEGPLGVPAEDVRAAGRAGAQEAQEGGVESRRLQPHIGGGTQNN